MIAGVLGFIRKRGCGQGGKKRLRRTFYKASDSESNSVDATRELAQWWRWELKGEG